MIEIIISSLATYGISKLVSSYDGLYGVFVRLRTKYPSSPLNCVPCLSVFLAIPIAYISEIGFMGYLATLGTIIMIDRLIS